MTHGLGGRAAGGALGRGGDRGGGALQGNPHEGRGRGQEHGIGLGTGLLEDAALLHACGAEVERPAAGQEEGVGGGVEGDDLVADNRHGQLGTLGDAVNP